MKKAEEWEEPQVIIGFGTATTITEYKKKQRVRKKNVIGFNPRPKK